MEEFKDVTPGEGKVSPEERDRTKETVLNGAAILGMLGSQIGDPTAAIRAQKLAEEENNDLDKAKVQEVIIDEDQDKGESEFTFDNSIGSGLDEDGFAVEVNSDIEIENINGDEILSKIINIENWDGYTLEKVGDIDSVNYIPENVKFDNSEILPRSYIIPLHDDGLVDLDKDVVEYILNPGQMGSFQVSRVFTISSTTGEILTFGAPDPDLESGFNGQFLILISIEMLDKKVSFFKQISEPVLIQHYNNVSGETLNEDDRQHLLKWENNLGSYQSFQDSNYDELLSKYDPNFYLTGCTYQSGQVGNFISIFSDSIDLNSDNNIVNEIVTLAKEVNSLKLDRENINDVEQNRRNLAVTDSIGLVYYLDKTYPELNIPFFAFGINWEDVNNVIGQRGLYNEIEDIFQKSENGVYYIDVPADKNEDGGFSSYSNESGQIELHIGEFDIDYFNVGDVISVFGDQDESLDGYIIVLNKILTSENKVILQVAQADRYGQRRLIDIDIDSVNINQILGSERFFIIRSANIREN